MSYQRDTEDFLLYCELTKQYSNNTVRNYRNTLERFGKFLQTKKIEFTKEIDLRVVNDYRKFLNNQITLRGDKMSLKAQAYQIVVLRSFFKFMIRSGSLVLNPDKLELPKARMRRIQFLSDKEITQLIEAISQDINIPEVQKKRNKAIIMTIFGSGLRISELLDLKKVDLPTREDTESRIIIQGKGGKIRSSFLSPVSKELIFEYLESRGIDQNPYLFISFSKNKPKTPKEWTPLTPRMIQMIIQNYARRLGIIKKVTPHILRHSFATKVLKEGGDLRSVQVLLGHANLATTQIYTHITDWQIKDLHSRVFGSHAKNKK